jgi:hypothetical protein
LLSVKGSVRAKAFRNASHQPERSLQDNVNSPASAYVGPAAPLVAAFQIQALVSLPSPSARSHVAEMCDVTNLTAISEPSFYLERQLRAEVSMTHSVPLPLIQSDQIATDTFTNAAKKTYRGLCWDRKHQSWRCRIFFASKQVRSQTLWQSILTAYWFWAYLYHDVSRLLSCEVRGGGPAQATQPVSQR